MTTASEHLLYDLNALADTLPEERQSGYWQQVIGAMCEVIEDHHDADRIMATARAIRDGYLPGCPFYGDGLPPGVVRNINGTMDDGRERHEIQY